MKMTCSGEAAVPRVSVFLPVRNGGALLDRALASLKAQTLEDWECVAVDDGSEDDTWARLQAWAAADRRFRPARIPHGGIVAALHAALAASSPTPYIARLDADDECHPDRLARQTAFLEARPEVGLVGCRVRFGGDPLLAHGFKRHVDWLNSLLTPEAIFLARFRDSPLAHPSTLFRRSLVVAHGWYADGPFPEDYELWLRWLDSGARMAKTPETLLTWNDPPDRLTRTHDNYAEEAFTRVRTRYLARWLLRRYALPQAGAAGRVPVTVWGAGRVSRRRALPLERFRMLYGGAPAGAGSEPRGQGQTAFFPPHVGGARVAVHPGSNQEGQSVRITAWIDIDPRKIGNRVAGRPVCGREALPPPGAGIILVFLSAWGAGEEAAAWLLARGYREGKDFLLCS